MKDIIQKCLMKCDELKASVIAFPALGAGNLNFPIHVVASTMISTMVDYIKANINTMHIKTIKLVIYTKDDYQNFYRVLHSNTKLLANDTKFDGAYSLPDLSPVETGVSYSEQSNTFLDNISSMLDKTHSLAKRVSQILSNDTEGAQLQHSKSNSLLSQNFTSNIVDSHMVGTVVVEFVEGDITDDNSDIIVTPSNEKMQLSNSGQISCAILKKGGSEIQIFCNNIISQGYRLKSGMAYPTDSAGDLMCKKIFHVNVHNGKLIEAVTACLQQAEISQLASIAFPAIGTGALGYDAEIAAQLMCQPVIMFAQSIPKYIKRVRFVIFEKSMMQCFKQVFCELLTTNASANLQTSAPHNQSSHLPGHAIDTVKPTSPVHSNTSAPVITAQSVLVLQVFADDVRKVQCTVNRLQHLIEKQLCTETVENKSIAKLTSELQTEIEQEAKAKNVDIVIALGKLQQYIQLKGDFRDVLELKLKINSILTKINDDEAKKKKIHDTHAKVKWQWQNKSGDFEDYDAAVNYIIEQAYQSDQSSLFVCNHTNGSSEEFDFKQMGARDINDGSTFKIQRKEIDHCKLYK